MLTKYFALILLTISINTCYSMENPKIPYLLQKTEKGQLKYACWVETAVFLKKLHDFPLDNFFEVADLATQCGESLDDNACTRLVDTTEKLTHLRQQECPQVLKKAEELAKEFERGAKEYRHLKKRSFLLHFKKKKAKSRRDDNHDALYRLNQSSLCLKFDFLAKRTSFRRCINDKNCSSFLVTLNDRSDSYKEEILVQAAQELQTTVLNYHACPIDTKEQD